MIYSFKRIFKNLYPSSCSIRHLATCSMCCFCLALISCSEDDNPTPRPKPKVTGLSNDTTPKASKTWTWQCENNDNTCKFRFAVNKKSSHTFGDSDLFASKKTATKTITQSSEDGTYYIHVQAENANGRSGIAKASAILKFTDTSGQLQVAGLGPNDTTPKSFKTWTWGCTNNSGVCTYRHAINKSATHSFSNNNDPFTSTANADKVLTSSSDDGTYYIHVQAKDSNETSPIAKASAVLQFTAPPPLQVSGLPTTPDTTPKTSKTWTWVCENNTGTCTYRHAINKDPNHTFTDNDTFNATTTATKTLTASSEDGTYYLHVQTKDSNGSSAIARTSAVLQFSTTSQLQVTGLGSNDTTPKSFKTWTWGCINNSGTCTYRHAINKDPNHTFTDNDTFNATTTATKTLTASSEDETYYIHVQAKDSNGTSPIAKASAVLQFTAPPPLQVSGLPTTPDTTPKTSKTWTWVCENNTGTCTYRHAINKDPNHTFTDNDTFNATTTATKALTASSEDGTYYLHVQTKDSNGTSAIARTSAVLKFVPPLTLKSPTPHQNPLQLYTELRPTFEIQSIPNGKWVALYEGSSCQTKLSDDGTVISGKAELKPMQNLHYRAYDIYLGVRDSQSDTTVDCQTQGVKYIAYRPLALFSSFGCYLFNHGKVVCWGRNDFGELGQSNGKNIGKVATENNTDRPMSALKGKFINLGTNRLATAIAVGSNHTCALLDNGTVKCWGVNQVGQLGQGNIIDIGKEANDMTNLQPINLGTGRKAKFITAGYYHSCALLDNDTVKCWGANDDGELGQNNTSKIGTGPNQMGDNLTALDFGCRTNTNPCPATDQLKPISIASGLNHNCALFQDRVSMKCWGWNAQGQLGQNTRTTRGGKYNHQ